MFQLRMMSGSVTGMCASSVSVEPPPVAPTDIEPPWLELGAAGRAATP